MEDITFLHYNRLVLFKGHRSLTHNSNIGKRFRDISRRVREYRRGAARESRRRKDIVPPPAGNIRSIRILRPGIIVFPQHFPSRQIQFLAIRWNWSEIGSVPRLKETKSRRFNDRRQCCGAKECERDTSGERERERESNSNPWREIPTD